MSKNVAQVTTGWEDTMFTKTTCGMTTVIKVQGSLDGDTFPGLIQQADEAFEEGHVRLIIDLCQVDQISTGAMIALQTIAAQSLDRGGGTTLAGINGDVEKWLDLAGVLRMVNLCAASDVPGAEFSQSQPKHASKTPGRMRILNESFPRG